RRADMACEVHIANVDAQLQGSGGYQDLDLTVLEFVFRVETQLARQAAMVCGNGVFAQTLRQAESNTLRQPPRIDKDQRGTMLFHQLADAVIGLIPEFIGGDGAHFLARNFDSEIQRALVADVDYNWIGPAVAGKEVSYGLNRLLRGRKTDANGS